MTEFVRMSLKSKEAPPRGTEHPSVVSFFQLGAKLISNTLASKCRYNEVGFSVALSFSRRLTALYSFFVIIHVLINLLFFLYIQDKKFFEVLPSNQDDQKNIFKKKKLLVPRSLIDLWSF
jgi:hypothetical protein